MRGASTVLVGAFALLSLLLCAAALGPSHGSTGRAMALPLAGVPPAHAPTISALATEKSGSVALAKDARPAGLPYAPTGAVVQPHWSGPDWSRDVSVKFSVPYQNTTPNIDYVPHNSTVGQYALGWTLTVSTDVKIDAANVNIWATGWPGGLLGAPVPGYDPGNAANGQDTKSMIIDKTGKSASWFFNEKKFFFPGTTVSFNCELESAAATPSKIWSNATIAEKEPYPTGYVDNATWIVDVQSPWASPVFDSDIAITTTPSVTTTPAFAPNAGQKLYVTVHSLAVPGALPTAIPHALLQFTVSSVFNGKATNSSYSAQFYPQNATVATALLGNFPNTQITFNVSADLPWQGGTGSIDRINSKVFSFNWSTKGGWWQPTEPLETNAMVNASPNVLTTFPVHLPTGTQVNVTVHEPIQNVTINSAVVNFVFNDRGARYAGSVPMVRANQNTTYAVLPGLPPNSSLTISVVAKDFFDNALGSGSYTYVENGTPIFPAPPGQGFFFVEVYDVAVHALVPTANLSIQNATWSQGATGQPFGFAVLVAYGSSAFVFLNNGPYLLTVMVFGQTIVRAISVTASAPFTIVVYASSMPVVLESSAPPPPALQIGGIVGIVAAAVSSYPIMIWWRERRARAEEEQRRVTL